MFPDTETTAEIRTAPLGPPLLIGYEAGNPVTVLAGGYRGEVGRIVEPYTGRYYLQNHGPLWTVSVCGRLVVISAVGMTPTAEVAR